MWGLGLMLLHSCLPLCSQNFHFERFFRTCSCAILTLIVFKNKIIPSLRDHQLSLQNNSSCTAVKVSYVVYSRNNEALKEGHCRDSSAFPIHTSSFYIPHLKL